MNIVEKLLAIDSGKLEMPTKDITLKLNKLGGEEFTFQCKAIDPEEMAEIQQNALTIKKGDIKKIDMYEMKVMTVIEGCSDVFKNMDIVNHFGTPTPKELVKKLLLSGEIDELYNTINELSGYDKEKEDEEEIKNS